MMSIAPEASTIADGGSKFDMAMTIQPSPISSAVLRPGAPPPMPSAG